MLLISDFAGQHQTVGAALGQGWSVLGAVLVAVYTECFGAAYNSLGWFMGMLSIVMAVSIGAACYVAKESPLEKSMEKQSCCQNVTSAFGSILSAVRTLPKVLVVYCIVLFFIQYAYAAYNGNKGMFFGIEVFDGDAINAATCDEECSEEQRDYNRGVRLAGGVADILFCVVGYVYSWVLPPLVRRCGVQLVATFAVIPQMLLMAMAFCDVLVLDYRRAHLVTIVHVQNDSNDIGVYVGVLASVTSSGQLHSTLSSVLL